MIRAVLSHDIDRTRKTYQFFSRPLKALIRGDMQSVKRLMETFFKKGNYWTFDEITKIEKHFGIRSTFFFLNESINFNLFRPGTFILAFGRYNILDPKIVDQIRWLDENGWEIGVHGSFNSFNNIGLLKQEKGILEQIVGHPVIGIRQHHLNLSSETWELQNSAGFRYDSSFGSNESNGFFEGKFKPFKPLDNDFTVFPQVLMDKCFMESKNRWDDLENYIDICEKQGAILVINFHNHSFNDKEFPGYSKAYVRIIERCLERGVVFRKFSELISARNA
jgi:hypothetical protein